LTSCDIPRPFFQHVVFIKPGHPHSTTAHSLFFGVIYQPTGSPPIPPSSSLCHLADVLGPCHEEYRLWSGLADFPSRECKVITSLGPWIHSSRYNQRTYRTNIQ
jgi:hypothetical protein